MLKSTTGIDNRTYSNMKQGKNINKLNVVSTCLGIHIPFPVSSRMLELAQLPMNLSLPGKSGEDNRQYDLILHLKWATDYDDIFVELQEQGYDYLMSFFLRTNFWKTLRTKTEQDSTLQVLR